MKKYLLFIENTCDSLFSKFYPVILNILFLIVFFSTFFRLFTFNNLWDSWIVGDWLINYNFGFTRRGLAGTLFMYVQNITSFPLNRIVLITQIIFLIIFTTHLLQKIRNKKITFWFMFLATSPAFLLTYLYDGMYVGRKEILIFILFLYWTEKSKILTFKKSIIFGFIGFLITLSHELFFFYSFYFVFNSYLISLKSKTLTNWKYSLTIPILSASAMFLVLVFGMNYNEPYICKDLILRGANSDICSGIISWENSDTISLAKEFYKNFGYKTLIGVFFIFAIPLFPLYFFYKCYSGKKFKTKKIFLIHFLLIFLTLPLFFVAIDWGRWIHVHMTLILIIISDMLVKNENISHDSKYKLNSFFIATVSGLLLLSSTFFWNLQSCCGIESFQLFGPYKKIKTLFRKYLL